MKLKKKTKTKVPKKKNLGAKTQEFINLGSHTWALIKKKHSKGCPPYFLKIND
jgi:hypothetical protein